MQASRNLEDCGTSQLELVIKRVAGQTLFTCQGSQHLRVSGGVLRTNYCNGRSSPAPPVTVAPSCVHRSSSCGVHRIALAVIAAPAPVEGVYRTTITLAPVVMSQPWPPSCLRSPPLRRSIRWAALTPTTTLTTLALTTPATTGGISRYIVEYNAPAPWCLTPRLRRLWSLWSLGWRSPPSCGTPCASRRLWLARGPLTKTGNLQDTFARHVLLLSGVSSHCHDTHGKTHCCGSHPLGPTVDRQVSVNSGVRNS